MVALMALASVGTALFGGWIAMRNRDRLHLLLGLTAGIVLGVVMFELLPELFELADRTGRDPLHPMVALVCGFLAFHIVEKALALHSSHEVDYHTHSHLDAGALSAFAIAAHSLADGIGIGLAYQTSETLGASVAIAVVAHRFADGLNTVGVTLAHDHTSRRSARWLLVVAAAPVVGALLTLFFSVGEVGLMTYLGFFAGALLYLGATDILPEAHSRHPSALTLGTTVIGIASMLVLAITVGE